MSIYYSLPFEHIGTKKEDGQYGPFLTEFSQLHVILNTLTQTIQEARMKFVSSASWEGVQIPQPKFTRTATSKNAVTTHKPFFSKKKADKNSKQCLHCTTTPPCWNFNDGKGVPQIRPQRK